MKLDPPKTVKPITEMTKDEKLALFKETLSSDEFKNITPEELGITVPEPPVDTEAKNAEVVKEWLPKYEEARTHLAEVKFKFDDVKMSEAEKAINERLEKQATAKFQELKSEVLNIDKDFPIEIVEKMSINSDDRNVVMTALKEVAVRNADAIKTLRKELDTATAELKDAKLAAPDTEKPDRSGADLVDSKLKEWGMEDKIPKDPPADDGK